MFGSPIQIHVGDDELEQLNEQVTNELGQLRELLKEE